MLASHCPKVDPRKTHKYVPLPAASGIFWHAKDCPMSPEVDADAGETQPGSYDGIRCAHECPDVFMMFYNILTITSKVWESARPA